MEKLKATVEIELLMREDETIAQAADRLYDLLYDGLVRAEDHNADFWIVEAE